MFDHMRTPDHPGLLDLLEESNGHYAPPLPPLDTVFPVRVVNEIMYDGRTQNIVVYYLARDGTFEEAQETLRTAATSWQSEMFAREADDDGKNEPTEGWLYQVIVNGLPEKKFRVLDSEREWKALRKCVVDGKGEVVVWEARMHAEMQRRRARAKEADKHGEVDFHNICEMDFEATMSFDPLSEDEDCETDMPRRSSVMSVKTVDSVVGMDDAIKAEGCTIKGEEAKVDVKSLVHGAGGT